jgi:hypothetical protein
MYQYYMKHKWLKPINKNTKTVRRKEKNGQEEIHFKYGISRLK